MHDSNSRASVKVVLVPMGKKRNLAHDETGDATRVQAKGQGAGRVMPHDWWARVLARQASPMEHESCPRGRVKDDMSERGSNKAISQLWSSRAEIQIRFTHRNASQRLGGAFGSIKMSGFGGFAAALLRLSSPRGCTGHKGTICVQLEKNALRR